MEVLVYLSLPLVEVLEKIVVPLFLELFSWSALLMSFGELVIYVGLCV